MQQEKDKQEFKCVLQLFNEIKNRLCILDYKQLTFCNTFITLNIFKTYIYIYMLGEFASNNQQPIIDIKNKVNNYRITRIK